MAFGDDEIMHEATTAALRKGLVSCWGGASRSAARTPAGFTKPQYTEQVVTPVHAFLFGDGEEGRQLGVFRQMTDAAHEQASPAVVAGKLRAIFDERRAQAPAASAHENPAVATARSWHIQKFFDTAGDALARTKIMGLADAFGDCWIATGAAGAAPPGRTPPRR